MTNTTIFVVTEHNLMDNVTTVSAFSTIDKAQEYVGRIIKEYGVDGADVINDGLNWYDDDLNYFDILVTITTVE